MLGKQGRTSGWVKESGDEEKREDREKMEGAKIIFSLQKQKQKQN